MTQPTQKIDERIFAVYAAKLLGKAWCLVDQDPPDFLVTEGEQRFGLEVCDIFTGPQDENGSDRKRKESENQRAVDVLRDQYEKNGGVPLNVHFLGDVRNKENAEAFLQALVDMELSRMPLKKEDRTFIEVIKGAAHLRDDSKWIYPTNSLRVSLRPVPHADWLSVEHRVGWVNKDPKDLISAVIKKKSEKLHAYRDGTGLNDIRLLIVANRTMNSGKLSLREYHEFDFRGFQVVYFLSYPEYANPLNRANREGGLS